MVLKPAAKPRETVPPDKYAEDYIISYLTGIERSTLERKKSGDRLVADTYHKNGVSYCCPKNANQSVPVPHHAWDRVGKYHQRTVYRLNLKAKRPLLEPMKPLEHGDDIAPL